MESQRVQSELQMNLEPDKGNSTSGSAPAALAWVLPIAVNLLALGYAGWFIFGNSFDAEQARLHPLPVLANIVDQISYAAPPWEWNIPLWSIAVWMIWLASVTTVGIGITRWMLWESISLSARFTLSFAAGFTLFGWMQMVFALSGMARFPIPLGIFLITALILFIKNKPIRNDVIALPRAARWRWKTESRSGRAVISLMITAAALMLPPALTPPAQSDGVRYHLGAPQEFIKNGSVDFLPGNAYSNMPFLVEMNFMAALQVRAPEASHLIHLSLALFTTLSIYALTRRLWMSNTSSTVAMLPALAYFTAPMSAIVATWPYTDHGLAFLTVASVISAIICLESPQRLHHWLMLGICLGGLVGTKYTMGPIAVLVYGLTLILARWPRNVTIWLPVIRAATAAAGITILIGGIWFFRNWIVVGNPVYPFATKLFPGGDWTIVNDAFLQNRAGLKGFGKSLTDLLAAPWTTTFRWIHFEAHNPGPMIILTLFFALAGIIAMLRRSAAPSSKRELTLVILTALASSLIWFYTYQSNRLLLPAIALGLAMLPAGLFLTRGLRERLLTSGVMLCSIMGILWAVQWSWVTTRLTPPPLTYLLGQIDSKTFLYRSLTYARAFDYLNERVRPYERVLLIGEHRIYGAKFNAIWSDWFDTPALARLIRTEQIVSTDQLLHHLRQNNIPWILINEKELEPQLVRDFRPWFTAAEWQIFEDLRTLSGPGVRVVKLPPGATVIYLEPVP